MRKKRFTEERITIALRQGEAGTPVEEICRKLGVTEATYYRWKKKFGSLGVPEIRELRQLRQENQKLKQLVDFMLSLPLTGRMRLDSPVQCQCWKP